MLGKSNQIKTKVIYEDRRIDIEINEFLQNNPDIEVVEMKFNTYAHPFDGGDWCAEDRVLIIYHEATT